MTITLHWWMLPLAIQIIGTAIAWKVASTPESGMFPMAPLYGAIIFTITATAAVGICIGRWIG